MHTCDQTSDNNTEKLILKKSQNAESFKHLKKKYLKLLRSTYTFLWSFYISSYVNFKISFYKNMFLTHIFEIQIFKI